MSEQAWLYTVEQSGAFFEALRKASIKILQHFKLPHSQGGKRYRNWMHGRPTGVTEHFTAGVGWQGSVRWLNAGGHDNKVSCQLLILDRMLPEVEAIYADYPELAALKVVVILMSDGLIPCWHAGWVNRRTIGIENRNAGILRGVEGDWRWWANGWKAKFPHEALGKTPILIDGHWWEPYTVGQVEANIIVCQHLHCLYQDSLLYGEEVRGLDARWFLPHSATTGSKWDTGRAYPLQDVRDAVFAQMPIEGIPWLKSYAADPTEYVQELEDEETELFLKELEERQTDRQGLGEVDESVPAALPDPDFQDLIDGGNWRDALDEVRAALHLLGYVTGGQGSELDGDTALAVYQFQKSQGDLKTDKVPGNVTQKALYRRLTDFGLNA